LVTEIRLSVLIVNLKAAGPVEVVYSILQVVVGVLLMTTFQGIGVFV
jgi:hypothetical protein